MGRMTYPMKWKIKFMWTKPPTRWFKQPMCEDLDRFLPVYSDILQPPLDLWWICLLNWMDLINQQLSSGRRWFHQKYATDGIIWLNHNHNSLLTFKIAEIWSFGAIWRWFPFLTIIPVTSQWGHHNSSKCIIVVQQWSGVWKLENIS